MDKNVELFLGYLFQTHIPRADRNKKSPAQVFVGATDFTVSS
jgi:hypothetical protein